METRKLRTILQCRNFVDEERCHSIIQRKENESWNEVLKKAGWKWCGRPYTFKGELYCKTCTRSHEIKYNINPDTGMRYEKKETKDPTIYNSSKASTEQSA